MIPILTRPPHSYRPIPLALREITVAKDRGKPYINPIDPLTCRSEVPTPVERVHPSMALLPTVNRTRPLSQAMPVEQRVY